MKSDQIRVFKRLTLNFTPLAIKILEKGKEKRFKMIIDCICIQRSVEKVKKTDTYQCIVLRM